jgi:HD superfamily phosphohydrolase YqeK
MLHDAARVLPKDKIKRLIKKLGRDAVNKKEKEYEQV